MMALRKEGCLTPSITNRESRRRTACASRHAKKHNVLHRFSCDCIILAELATRNSRLATPQEIVPNHERGTNREP